MNIDIPRLIFGTSALGNLYSAIPFEKKLRIVDQILYHNPNMAVFDCAGKYGAGLALESLGNCLKQLQVPQQRVQISNKLGWKRVPLQSAEPTFEPGVWVDLKYDAVQAINYDGILECYEQGNKLLNGYTSEIVSVHDPDEYIAAADTDNNRKRRQKDVLDAYRALENLKASGDVRLVGIGAKDTDVIDFVSDHVQLDWAMMANSLTPLTHTIKVRRLLDKLREQGVNIINSAVFNGGFLVGENYLNYKLVTPETHPEEFLWREKFNQLCSKYNLSAALVCVQFSFLFRGVCSIALNTTSPERIVKNISLVCESVPMDFWRELQRMNMLEIDIDQIVR